MKPQNPSQSRRAGIRLKLATSSAVLAALALALVGGSALAAPKTKFNCMAYAMVNGFPVEFAGTSTDELKARHRALKACHARYTNCTVSFCRHV
jgi:hypothetical protein